MAGKLTEQLQRILDIKNEIKESIRRKNIELEDSVPFSQYGNKIREIITDGSEIYEYELFTNLTKNETSCANLFREKDITECPLFDTSQTTTMNSMFYGCENLEIVPKLNTTSVLDMGYLFANCKKISEFPPNWVTDKVTTMEGIFYNCQELTTLHDNFDTSSCVNMSSAFLNCYKLSDISVLNLASLQNGASMFKNLTKLDYISLEMPVLVNGNEMFMNNGGLTTIEYLAIPLCQSATRLFNGCSNLRRINKLATNKLTSIKYMSDIFLGCNNLEYIGFESTDSTTVNEMIKLLPQRTTVGTIDVQYCSDVVRANASTDRTDWEIIGR